MSRCRWLRSPRSAGCPRRRPVTSFCMNLRTCWLQTPAMARRGGTRRAKLACCARARGRTLVRWRTGEKSPPPSAPRCRRFPNRPKACRPSTTTTGSGGPVVVAAAPVAGAPTRRRAPCRNRHGFARRCAVSGLAALWVGLEKYHQGAAGPSQRPTAARRTAVPVARRSPNMLRQPVKRGSSGAAGVGVDRTVASGAQRPHNRFR